ncbi:MAG: PEGA domain-containing protein [Lentisphaeria bacterium]|jgi:pSer/pThr/pTyr-binding forkhead associated (FHA) protein|nr:PEGA domain-containing protein [Lentisphaeria bacterium]MDP7743674.1 PEGA domain-containing protein [Lentisphaeria bacterium]
MDAKLKYSSGRHAGHTVNINTGEFLIGRGDQCQLRLDDDNTSREHAVIRCQGDRCVIVDLGSTNGILVNGVKVKDATLVPGDRITISDTCLKFIDDAAPASAPRPTAPAATAAAVELPDRSPTGNWASAVVWGLLVLACVIVLALILPGSDSRPNTAAAGSDDQAVAGRDDGAAATQAAVPDTGNATVDETGPDDTGRDTGGRDDTTTTDDTVAAVDNTAEDAPDEDDFVADELDWMAAGNDPDELDWMAAGNDPDELDWAPAGNDPDGLDWAPAGNDPDELDDAPVRIPPPEPEPLRPEPVYQTPPPSANDIPVDYLWVTTEPPGARVSVNGKRRGRTPVYLGALTAGQYRVSFAKHGFEHLSVDADVPNDGDQQIYALTQKNGTCLVQSDPPHMSVRYGPQLLGQTPLMLDSMTPGSYRLRVFGLYYKPEFIEVDIDEDEPNAVFVDLVPVMGNIEIVTIPPGAKVFVDNSYKGATKGNPDGMRRSEPLSLSGFNAGRHRVQVKYDGEVAQKSVGVRPGQTAEAYLTIWYPDTRFKLISGKEITGMVLERSDDGSVVLALSRSEHKRYLKEQIEAEEKLTEKEAKHLMRLAKQAEWLDK